MVEAIMVLVMGNEGLLRDRIVEKLEQDGAAGAVIGIDHDDPFSMAAGSRAVVLVAPPHASAEIARSALSAAHAPGVEVLVVVLPEEGADPAIVDRIPEDGVPYVIVRTPMLLEELGERIGARRIVVVEKGERLRAIAAGAVAAAVRAALDTEEQGRAITLLDEPREAAVLLAEAAALTGRRVRVLSLWPPLARAARWLLRLLRRPLPALTSPSMAR